MDENQRIILLNFRESLLMEIKKKIEKTKESIHIKEIHLANDKDRKILATDYVIFENTFSDKITLEILYKWVDYLLKYNKGNIELDILAEKLETQIKEECKSLIYINTRDLLELDIKPLIKKFLCELINSKSF